jgi:ATP-dependent exoDNAse (exonuclease V) alpha subunit
MSTAVRPRQQIDADLQAVADAIVCSTSARQSLAGLAGTGKTTVAMAVYNGWVARGLRVKVLAPTGKAASVLQYKGVPATTIHSEIYYFRGKFLDDRGNEQLLFEDNKKRGGADRYIVDETSMVTKKQKDDIESRGIATLWVGDPGQLRPVMSKPTGLLSKPTHLLREIRRQAAGNPIISWSHALRRGASIEQPFPGIEHLECLGRGPTYVANQMLDRCINRLVVKTNVQRVALNAAMRTATGKKGLLDEGDEIICCLNNKRLGVVNGDIFSVLEVRKSNSAYHEAIVRNIVNGQKQRVHIWNSQFGQAARVEEEIDQEYMLADYAAAITCHKMQGSSAAHVGIAAKGYCDHDTSWNYTAATRAEEFVTVFC